MKTTPLKSAGAKDPVYDISLEFNDLDVTATVLQQLTNDRLTTILSYDNDLPMITDRTMTVTSKPLFNDCPTTV